MTLLLFISFNQQGCDGGQSRNVILTPNCTADCLDPGTERGTGIFSTPLRFHHSCNALLVTCGGRLEYIPGHQNGNASSNNQINSSLGKQTMNCRVLVNMTVVNMTVVNMTVLKMASWDCESKLGKFELSGENTTYECRREVLKHPALPCQDKGVHLPSFDCTAEVFVERTCFRSCPQGRLL
jgi:hypothetical protein